MGVGGSVLETAKTSGREVEKKKGLSYFHFVDPVEHLEKKKASCFRT